jgi:phosphoribosylaminoimidazolecarboxamide formyltransferase / IMP cyclohydrolase
MTTRQALLSVSDKTGLIDFARGLLALGFELLSTGGSAKALRDQGLAVRDVAEITGFPEIMDGRVKTLHPKVHGGLLGRLPLDAEVMTQHGIHAIDVVAVNLYPFAQTIAKPDCTLDDAIENIDIGGPAMLRAAAKNHARVWTVCDPSDYAQVLSALANGDTTTHTHHRRTLAAKVYAHTADYDGRVAGYLSHQAERLSSTESTPANAVLPPVLTLQFERVDTLRYGENPHQHAALYRERPLRTDCVTNARFLQGKALSYNNIADADAALETVRLFDAPACVIVKHANPCGVACAATLLDAYQAALATDPVSAFGGIIAFNRTLDEATAKAIVKLFVEVVIAPGFSDGALQALSSKTNVRVLTLDGNLQAAPAWRDLKRVQGGLLVQSGDTDIPASGANAHKVVSHRAPTDAEFADLHFAWKVAMQVKSNAIVYAKAQRTIGVGAGQMSRVVSAKIAGWKAGEAGLEVPGSVMASDAFFPFRDGIDAAASVGITAVIQPGGSMRDQEVIDAANAHGMAMVFTGIRHFKH